MVLDYLKLSFTLSCSSPSRQYTLEFCNYFCHEEAVNSDWMHYHKWWPFLEMSSQNFKLFPKRCNNLSILLCSFSNVFALNDPVGFRWTTSKEWHMDKFLDPSFLYIGEITTTPALRNVESRTFWVINYTTKAKQQHTSTHTRQRLVLSIIHSFQTFHEKCWTLCNKSKSQ